MVDPSHSAGLSHLHAVMRGMWARTDLPPVGLPVSDKNHNGYESVWPRSGLYDIEVWERGQLNSARRGLSLHETALNFLFSAASAHYLAKELKERTPPPEPRMISENVTDDGYSRWNWMAPTIAVMERISPEAGAYARAEYGAPGLADWEIRNARYPLPD